MTANVANSDTPEIEPTSGKELPQHIAIIMDGNGRWAQHRHLPRFAGHKAGVKATRIVVEVCAKMNIKALTIFAFSSENWQRPRKEVDLLMDLFISALRDEAKSLHNNNIQVRVVGNRSALSKKLQSRIAGVESLTENNTGMVLVIAANYGGRWDIVQAVKNLLADDINPDDLDEPLLDSYLNLSDLPTPDLFIRTGGEHRISNFLLWQLAYTELYFTDILWPDFDEKELNRAIQDYVGRHRRFGRTREQVEEA